MNVLVIGNGGREHALVWKLKQSKRVGKIFVVPGNPGTAILANNVEIDYADFGSLLKFAQENKIDFTIVGPEKPLVAGIVDVFRQAGLAIIGPDKKAARLEGSKIFAKRFMKKYGIPTANYETFTDEKTALQYIKKVCKPIVIKADGLAEGKGVFIAKNEQQAVEAVYLLKERFGRASQKIVVEEFLNGEEASVLAFTDGKTILPMIAVQDNKAIFNHDQGPNTGGMGSYAPLIFMTDELKKWIRKKIILPTLTALQQEKINYKGVLYFGLMVNEGRAKVLEYNVRFGDPETQVILPLLQNDLLDIFTSILDERLAETKLIWLARKALCVIMASGGYPGNYQTSKRIRGIEQAELIKGINVFQAGTINRDGNLLTAGGRVLGVTAIAEDMKSAIDKAYQAVAKIDFPDSYYRTDIGRKSLKAKIEQD